jgi:hypothetical protein
MFRFYSGFSLDSCFHTIKFHFDDQATSEEIQEGVSAKQDLEKVCEPLKLQKARRLRSYMINFSKGIGYISATFKAQS